MADLHVKPKEKSRSILPWILLGLGILALLIFLARGCNDDEKDTAAVTTDTTNTSVSSTANNTAANTQNGWNDIDFNAPAAKYDEITDKNIDVRGNDRYGIYGLGEDILFDEGKSTIRTDAEANLKQITSSISKRYNGGDVRIYGHTDATGSAGTNKELSEKRAEAVRNWLVKNGNLAEGNVSLHPAGESRPVATNSTEAGRQKNRRVEIVARTGTNNTGQ
ncbi:MAG TPA: OmpA family protein [Chitinophagaceae bacterium]|nr:OmpA family protein [Chitinophagaceae bacterium]